MKKNQRKLATLLAYYWEKIYSHFRYTVKEAQKLVGFPIKKPTYTAKGYELKKEKVDTDITLRKSEPIINSRYKKGEFSYTIYQSAIMEKGKDSSYQIVIIDDILNKAELEKIMISFLK
ncbi:hypothetical protein RGU76_00830 [Bacillus pseudomycoides]|uniref:hypothetical protein n=1 Tax=Bacillus sp. DHT2 TaxID=2994532 RepID=UPI002248CFA7|nr:hypothetical protein [Bacillus sp. DHT2]MDR4913703.1 hypothetical protein [Bacillus pseudomycoides]